MLSGRSLCDELITRPEESYRLCCVVVCDLETSRLSAPYIYYISLLRVKLYFTIPSREYTVFFFSETNFRSRQVSLPLPDNIEVQFAWLAVTQDIYCQEDRLAGRQAVTPPPQSLITPTDLSTFSHPTPTV